MKIIIVTVLCLDKIVLTTEIYYKNETYDYIKENLFSIYGNRYKVTSILKASNAQFEPINNIKP